MSHLVKRERAQIHAPVERFMTTEVVRIPARASLQDARKLLAERRISCVPVFEDEHWVGTLSRTDLLRVRHFCRPSTDVLPLALKRVRDVCRFAPIVTVSPTCSVSRAAAHLVEKRVHRVFIEHNGALIGVFSTKDLLHAIVRSRVATKVEDVMSSPVFTIPADTPLARATDRLGQAHVSGVTVVDADGWPVGFYSQIEALEARESPPETAVGEVMNPALVCMHDRAPLGRAASVAYVARARRVLIVHDRRTIGILTPLDFARAVAA